MKGGKATCYYGVRDDIVLAGAGYIDRPAVVDGNLVTSRVPSDLPYMMKVLIALLRHARTSLG